MKAEVLAAQSCLTICNPMDQSSPGSCLWDSPGKNPGVGCHFLLQGIFPIQESNLGFPSCRQILYHLKPLKPKIICLFLYLITVVSASQVALVAKNPHANTGDQRDTGSIPVSGRTPGGRHGNSLQYSCLENPVDRGAPHLGYSLCGCKESDTTEAPYTCMHTL